MTVHSFHLQLIDVPETNTSSIYIDHLTPGVEYSFTIQSYSDMGRSHHTSPPVSVFMNGECLSSLLHYISSTV